MVREDHLTVCFACSGAMIGEYSPIAGSGATALAEETGLGLLEDGLFCRIMSRQ